MPIETVPADTRRRVYVATGGQTAFPVPFPFYANADLAVWRTRTGATVQLALGPDYTVTGAQVQAGGTVTLTSGALAGDQLVIEGRAIAARATQYFDGGDLTARALNDDSNRHTIVEQELLNRLNLTLRWPDGDPSLAPLLPAQPRGGLYLQFNADGTQLIATPGIGSPIPISAFMLTVLDDADAAAARATLGASGSVQVGDAVWTGNFDLLPGTETVFVELLLPTGTQRIHLTGSARAINTQPTFCDAILRASVTNAANVILGGGGQKELIILTAVAGDGQVQSSGFGVAFNLSAPSPAGAKIRAVGLKSAAVGPFNLLTFTIAATFVLA
jgi:hypothetical protein